MSHKIQAKTSNADAGDTNLADITSTQQGTKRALDVAIAGASFTIATKDYADGWAAPNHLPVVHAVVLAIPPIVNQVTVRLVPTDGKIYYYNFANTLTTLNSESFTQNSPIEVATNQTIYVIVAGGVDGDIVVYQASRT